MGIRARAAAGRRLAAVPHWLGCQVRQPGGLPECQRDRPAHARCVSRLRAVDRGGVSGDRHWRRDGGYRRRRRALLRPAVPLSFCIARGRQVRPDPAAESRIPASHRRRAGGGPASHRRRIREPDASARPGGAADVKVTEAIARELTGLGADTVFGVVGSGNFHLTNALIAHGARYVAARHECGAASMADAWARLAGRPALLSLHQGPGFTNALTGITEAAKSRTPLVVLAADVSAGAITSNFRIDVAAIAGATGAIAARLHSPGFAVDDAARAYRMARDERRTVVLALPLDVQAGECSWPGDPDPRLTAPSPPPESQAANLATILAGAARPVFVAGRGARSTAARAALEQLADECGALLATSAAAKGLFRGSPWDLDVSGGFASPLAAELIGNADVLVGWGCSLNMWTTRHGTLIGPRTTLVQVDCDSSANGRHRRVHLGVTGDVTLTATAVAELLKREPREPLPAGGTDRGDLPGTGYRSAALRDRIAAGIRWRDVPYDDESDGKRIDPRTLTIALDDML